jgi:hypothetical protein
MSDDETPAAELHVILAIMSAGPVGISNGIGMTNTTLLKHTITVDRLLLLELTPRAPLNQCVQSQTLLEALVFLHVPSSLTKTMVPHFLSIRKRGLEYNQS